MSYKQDLKQIFVLAQPNCFLHLHNLLTRNLALGVIVLRVPGFLLGGGGGCNKAMSVDSLEHSIIFYIYTGLSGLNLKEDEVHFYIVLPSDLCPSIRLLQILNETLWAGPPDPQFQI